jgi:hypothetical protein
VKKRTRSALLIGIFVLLTGCAPTVPVHEGLAWPEPQPMLAGYSRIIIEPVEIDRGSDGRFGGAGERELQRLAELTRREFVFFARPYVATSPGPGVARLKLTLAGLENNVPVATTLSRAIPTGLAMNPTHGAGERPGGL